MKDFKKIEPQNIDIMVNNLMKKLYNKEKVELLSSTSLIEAFK